MECVLFEVVSRDARPHPEERACRRSVANSKARARVSKDEDEPVRPPSCFETHRSAAEAVAAPSSRAAMLLSMRASIVGGGLAKRRHVGEPTCGCGKRSRAPLHCFRIVIYNEWRNFNVRSYKRAVRRSHASRRVALYFSLLLTGAAERRSATSVAGRRFPRSRRRESMRPNENQGPP